MEGLEQGEVQCLFVLVSYQNLLFSVLFFVCMSYMCVSAHVCGCSVCMYLWKPENNLRYHIPP